MPRTSNLQTAVIVLAALAGAGLSGNASAQERMRPGYGGGVPQGSYLESCRDIRLDGSLLRARCEARNGAPVTSFIDINSCRGRDIANDRGYLRCERDGGDRPGWGAGPGSGPGDRVRAVGYTEPNFRGRELPIYGPIENLAKTAGFNDTLRSIRLRRGDLEVCADSRYRGGCVVISRSIRDLGEVGMANRISSIR